VVCPSSFPLNSLQPVCDLSLSSSSVFSSSLSALTFPSPSLTSPEPCPPNSLKAPHQRSSYLTTGSAGMFTQTHMHLEDCWSKDHHLFFLQSAYPNGVTLDPSSKHRSGGTTHQDQCIWLYVITSNNMAMFNAEQSLTVELTIRLFCFSSPLTPHLLTDEDFQHAFYFNILLSFFSSSSLFSSCFVLLLLESTFLPLGQAYIEFHCQKIK